MILLAHNIMHALVTIIRSCRSVSKTIISLCSSQFLMERIFARAVHIIPDNFHIYDRICIMYTARCGGCWETLRSLHMRAQYNILYGITYYFSLSLSRSSPLPRADEFNKIATLCSGRFPRGNSTMTGDYTHIALPITYYIIISRFQSHRIILLFIGVRAIVDST